VGAVFGSVTPDQFLSVYWQRGPLLFRGALADYRAPITPDELAGLACEEEVESRIVLGHVGSRFQIEHGPFEEERFGSLPKRDWTLLVQDVDKHVPDVARLLERFRTLPDWRIDDIMVSFAAPGGSVGPHTDQYDVFLLQVQGRRRWQLSEHFSPELRSDCDLKVLARFVPERELTAEPGDILYLPPNVAHFGVALDEAMTFSIGFRAPDQRELVAAFARELGSEAKESLRFSDAGRVPARDPTELSAADLARLRELLRRGLGPSDAELDAFIGRHLTRPKPNLEVSGETLGVDQVERRLSEGARLVRRHGSRWAWLRRGDELWVFAEGHESRLPEHQRSWLCPLLEHTPLGADSLASDDAAIGQLARWLELGALEWQSNDDDDHDDDD
jgi:50S ribosomal protein L16 3-hydroxylase